MILQALVKAYEALAERGELEKPGWVEVKVSFALELDGQGKLLQVFPLGLPDKKGKRTARPMKLPAPVKRASGVAANFLCDNAMYMLGLDLKGKKDRALKCCAACAALNTRLLQGVEHPMARAICRFFETWDAEHAEEHPLIAPILAELKAGGNLIFSMDSTFAQEVPEIRAAWDRHYGDRADAPRGRCLVTGEEGPIALLHPSIKGVPGAQPTGASLVSFNAVSYESYGRSASQGLNAPVGERAAFAYGAALNYMLRERDYHTRLGDTTMVLWEAGAQRVYSAAMSYLMNSADDSSDDELDQQKLRQAIEELRRGKTALIDGISMNPENRFYILGLAPNASRLSVRFFLQNSFRAFAENLHEHQKRLEIVRPAFDEREELSLWMMLGETTNQKSKDKKPPDRLVGEVMRAILSNAPYPVSLFEQVQLRLRAEQDVSRGKAAIIKAYLLKNVVRDDDAHPMKEVLKVKLNDEATYTPYVLGRLFAVLEKLQVDSTDSKLSTTIRNRYFNAACATPMLVFPTLLKLAQAHLNRANEGTRVYYDKMLQELYTRLDETYPKRLTLEDQGVFQLGYYHQKQKLWTKKEDRDNG